MPEDKIFGPLTFKQFIRLVIGIALAYAAFTYLEGLQAQIAAGVIVVFTILITFIKGSESFDINRIDEYIRKMEAEKGREKTTMFLKKKTAEISSQIEMRKQKGLPEDPALKQACDLLQNALTKFENN